MSDMNQPPNYVGRENSWHTVPIDHMDARLELWLEAHHDPKWKPKKRVIRVSGPRKLTPLQLRRVTQTWEWAVAEQVRRYGTPTHSLEN